MTVEPVASAAAPAPPHALVTGGSRGLGRAIVVELAAAGYAVSFCYRSQSAAAATTLELARQRRPEAALWHAACDVADPDQVRDFVAAAIAEFGPAEVVVPAAGVNRDGPVALLAAADWTDVIDTDLSGVFHVVHEVVRPMMRLGRGRVITISSVAGCVGNAGQANYAAAKGGLNALTMTLAKELARFGITVNGIAPGYVDTDMTARLSSRQREKALASVPTGRFGQPEDVAPLVRFLASREADYITGQIIRVDGGLVL